jgi:regulator of protease activity HflC (stomatin/prohibitin superfamily)
MSKKNSTEEKEKSKIQWKELFSGSIMIVGFIVGFIIALIIMNGWYYVPGGSQGAMFNRISINDVQGYVPTELGEGLRFKVPFMQSVTKLPYRTQQINFCNQANNPNIDCHYDPLVPKDKNGINFEIDLSIRFKLDKTQIVELVQQKGSMSNIEQLIISAARAESTRGVFGTYTQEELPSVREEVSEKIFNKLQERMDYEATDNLKPGFLIIEALDLRNLDYNDVIEAAIIAKQKKKQEADAKIYDIQFANRTREEELINADKDRQSAIIRAEGTANATLLNGLAQAKTVQAANDAFKGMSPAYVLSKAYDSIGKNDKIIIGLDSLTSEGNSIMMFDPSKFTEGFGGVNSTN